MEVANGILLQVTGDHVDRLAERGPDVVVVDASGHHPDKERSATVGASAVVSILPARAFEPVVTSSTLPMRAASPPERLEDRTTHFRRRWCEAAGD